jgi:hypothetical protein
VKEHYAHNEELAKKFITPDNLSRFLWAREFNLDKALDMYKKMIVRLVESEIRVVMELGIQA